MSNRHEQPSPVVAELAYNLRDGLLQDLLAVSMLLEGAGADVDAHEAERASAILREANVTVRADIHVVRALIARLRAADAGACDHRAIGKHGD